MKGLFRKGVNTAFATMVTVTLAFGAWGAVSPLTADDQFCVFKASGCDDGGSCSLHCGPLHGQCYTPVWGGDCWCECNPPT